MDSDDSSSVKDDDITYSPSYPEMKDGKLFFEMDISYREDGTGKQITKDNFTRFDGDVKVTRLYLPMPLESPGSGYRSREQFPCALVDR